LKKTGFGFLGELAAGVGIGLLVVFRLNQTPAIGKK